MMMVFESSYKKCRVSHFSAVPFPKGDEHSGGGSIQNRLHSVLYVQPDFILSCLVRVTDVRQMRITYQFLPFPNYLQHLMILFFL